MSDLSQIVKPGDILNLQGYSAFDWKNFFWSIGERMAIDAIVRIQGHVFNRILKSNTMLYQDNHSTMYIGDNKIFSQEPPHATIIPLSDYENDKTRIVTVYRLNPNYIGRLLTDADIAWMVQSANIMATRKVPYDIARDVEDGVNDMTWKPWDASLNIFDSECNMSEDPNLITSSVCSQAVGIHVAHWRHQTQATTGELIKPLWHDFNPIAWTKYQIDTYPHYWDTAIIHPCQYAVTYEDFSHELLRMGRFQNGKRIA